MSYIQRLKSIFGSLERVDRIVNNAVVRQGYQTLYLTNNACGIEEKKYPEGEVIVSLTSYGKKLQQVYLTIESLLNQTVKPNRIILWLDKNNYASSKSIPSTLISQRNRGLEIRLCEDLRSYKKLVPALETFPEAIVITVDDDMIYPLDFIEGLYRAYQNDPGKVYFYRGHYMLFDKSGAPRPYSEWVLHGAEGCSIFNVPTGVSGILYSPHCYHEDMLAKDLFLRLCPYADDIWFKVMTYMKGTLCEKIDVFNYEKSFVPLDVDNQTSLQMINVVKGGNDVQIRKVFNYYHISG